MSGQGSTTRLTANYAPVGHLVVNSAISGLVIKVDGADCAAPCDLQRPVGTVLGNLAVDRARAENWFKKYDVMPAELKATLKLGSAVPIDVDPVFGFKEKLE